ncbi:heat shock factor 2-binding protein isoform X2 [Nerophis lumbriciformis]|uniref:heat shock factor 2-binding protein isoform X2 n=1 Tax=Nerophis lumbriciformis TaxID=546530 RepID=UPI002ADFDC4A|nr:heat shock factor 2-binding protein-like isoform X2 [Nerophis lumbriciformis]
MSASVRGTSRHLCHGAKDGFVKVRKRDLEKLTTEVMQLREFLPRVVNGMMIDILHKTQAQKTVKEHLTQEPELLRQECLHLQSRLDAVQTECQKERQEKCLLRDQLWQSQAEVQQQADFCSSLGSVACSLLWNCSTREDTVRLWLTEGNLQAFLSVATQTLESFVRTLDEAAKSSPEDHNTQFVLALAGTITNIAAVTCGREFLLAHDLLNTLIKLLELMKPNVFPKLKVLVLMALYNASISVTGLKCMSNNPVLLPLIRTLLEDRSWEVCLHSLRLLQSLLMEDGVHNRLGAAVMESDLQARVTRLTCSVEPSLRLIAQQTLDDIQVLKQGRGCKQNNL